MSKKQYSINNIALMETIPGSVKKTMKKGDEIFVNANDKAYIEALLTKEGISYIFKVSALEIVQFVIT